MRLFTAVILALTALLAISTVGAVVAAPAAGLASASQSPAADQSPIESTHSSSHQTASSVQGSTDPPDEADPRQVFRVSIDESGDAHWTIESRFLLEDEEDVDEFREWAESVTAGERDVGYDRQWFETRAADAAERTDRQMSIQNAGWDEPQVHTADADPVVDAPADEADDDGELRVGVVSYSVTWTNFATTDGDRIYVGDAFETDDGVWLSLTDGQRLVIEQPEGYALDQSSLLEWDGPHEFNPAELEIVFVQTGFNVDVGLFGWLLGGGALLIVLLVAGSYVATRRYSATTLPAPVVRIGERVAAVDSSDRLARLRSRIDPRATDDSSAVTGTDGGSVPPNTGERDADRPHTGTELEYDEPVDGGIDPELLSDEERVLRLLTENGGRMKQATIVKETGWSNAKVSQLLSQMDDDDDIEKLRIGRENLITLPDVDPTELD